jgi:hypothetical protein
MIGLRLFFWVGLSADGRISLVACLSALAQMKEFIVRWSSGRLEGWASRWPESQAESWTEGC